jgi:hypothetical protein
MGACTAAAETILGGLYAVSKDDAVDKCKVIGKDLGVDLVHDGDGT